VLPTALSLLPTRAQLLELRRAGVTEYRRTTGDETVLLTLRRGNPLSGPAPPQDTSDHGVSRSNGRCLALRTGLFTRKT
jgi:hypothetical protein